MNDCRNIKIKRKEIIRIAVTDGLVFLNWTAREYVNSKTMIDLPVAIVARQGMYLLTLSQSLSQETKEFSSSDIDEKNTFNSSWPLSRTRKSSTSSVYSGIQ